MDQKSNKGDIPINVKSDSKSKNDSSDSKQQQKSSSGDSKQQQKSTSTFISKSNMVSDTDNTAIAGPGNKDMDPQGKYDKNYALKPNVMAPSIDPPSHYNPPASSSVDSKKDWKSNSNMDPRTEKNLRMDPKTDTPLKPTTVTPSRTDYSHELKTGGKNLDDELVTATGSLKKLDNWVDPNFSRAIKLDPTLSSEMKHGNEPGAKDMNTSNKSTTVSKSSTSSGPVDVTDKNTFATTDTQKESKLSKYLQPAILGGGGFVALNMIRATMAKWALATPMFAGALYSLYKGMNVNKQNMNVNKQNMNVNKENKRE